MRSGDIVEIINNIPVQFKDCAKPIYGSVIGVDGYYILVQVANTGIECEFYPNELRNLKLFENN